MKYVAYYRVSTKKQGKSGLGLASQTEILNHYLAGSIETTFTDIESGKNSERSELKKAIDYCRKNNLGLAVAKVDRLSRNTEFALNVYSELNGYLFACDIPQEPGSKMDKFTLTIFLAIADREGELISLRTSSALQRKIQRDGKWQKENKDFTDGTVGKLGTAAKKEKSAKRENNKKVFETIRMYRNAGLNWLKIANKLNESGFGTAYNNEVVNGQKKKTKGFQAIQVQRIFEKYKD